MLRKIVRLQNVGLFYNGTPSPVETAKVTLLYGENGRGKSTLAALLRSCAEGRPDLVLRRKTIDRTGNPEVELLFDQGYTHFKDGAWSFQRPAILVFDDDFIDANAFTGKEITSDNRRNLYTFALGDAVELKARMDAAAAKANSSSKLRGEREKAMDAVRKPFSLAEFVAIPSDKVAQAKLDELQKKLLAASVSDQIRKREPLVALSEVSVDIAAAFSTFRRTLPGGMEPGTAALVEAHVRKYSSPEFEGWLNQGRSHAAGAECPYCGQSLEHVALAKAYSWYFNEAYNQIAAEVKVLEAQTIPGLVTIGESWRNVLGINRSRASAWADQGGAAAPVIDIEAATAELRELRQLLADLAEDKRRRPLEVVGTLTAEAQAVKRAETISAAIRAYNSEVALRNVEYENKKTLLAELTSSDLRNYIEQQSARVRRHTPEVARLVDDYVDAQSKAQEAAAEKDKEREAHDKVMSEILNRYAADINLYLGRFRAGFTIEQLKGQHAGGREPRTTYGIQLWGNVVRALQRDDYPDEACVPYSLSEGDKRTLALAFFLSRLKADASKAKRVVVFDDPVTSLDENRRKRTIDELTGLSQECDQVFTFSHDAYFLRELSERLSASSVEHASFKVGYGANDYSQIESCDISQLCESPYRTNYRLVSSYVDGVPNVDAHAVAKALRPLVEGFYKRRYPSHVQGSWNLGTIIKNARGAAPENPLSALKVIVRGLSEFNGYSSRFHHDGADGVPAEKLLESELRDYARQGLDVIHGDGKNLSV